MRRSWILFVGAVLWGTGALAQPGGAGRGSSGEVTGNLTGSFAAVARAIGPAVVRLDVAGADRAVTGSGIVLDTRGNVVTSHHVLDGSAAGAGGIVVTLADGRRFAAELVGGDAATDVAVVRIVDPPVDISAARFGDSDDAAVGEWVLSVGSALGLDQTIRQEPSEGSLDLPRRLRWAKPSSVNAFTAGIISARPERSDAGGAASGAFLLTDAKINPGDAGGPLVDLEGQVVGLTTLISAGPGGGYGYAVPINQVRRVAQQIVEEGHAGHPYIGVGLRAPGDVPGRDQGRAQAGVVRIEGALVSRVGLGTPAARAGLRAGDVITAVDDRQVPAPAELVTIIQREPVGTQVALSFVRGGRCHKIVVSVEDLPAVR